MSENPITEVKMRQFLLGTLDDIERQQIETLFITDPSSRERLLAAEQDLIEDYLEGSLTTADRESFLLHYADTPEQLQKLRITQTVREWAIKKGTAADRPIATATIWNRLRDILQGRPVFVVPLAVTAIILIVIAAVWVNRRTERNHLQVGSEEIARLNDPASLRQTPPLMSIVVLSPLSVRSAEKEAEVAKPATGSLVELRLLWLQKEDYPSYQAVVRRPGDDQPYTIDNLTIENDSGKVIRLRVLARILTRGNYQVELTGIAADGGKSPPEIYSFFVSE